jgi:hypothetical protein
MDQEAKSHSPDFLAIVEDYSPASSVILGRETDLYCEDVQHPAETSSVMTNLDLHDPSRFLLSRNVGDIT